MIDSIRYAIVRLYVWALFLTMTTRPICFGAQCQRCLWGLHILGKRICAYPIAVEMWLEDERKMEKEDGKWIDET